MMEKDLKDWLERHFLRDNHPKYRKYVQEGFDNITPNQIYGFQRDKDLETIFIN